MITGIGGNRNLTSALARGESISGRDSIQNWERNTTSTPGSEGGDVVQISGKSAQGTVGGAEAYGQPATDPADGQHQLSEAERKEVAELKKRDREVRQHENAHRAAAGQYARGMNLIFQQGPDGRSYAVGGEVTIDTSEIPGDPEATIAKARQIRSAAQAPANPSAQDRQVAAQASKMEAEAQAEKMREAQAARSGADADDGAVAGTADVGRASKSVSAYDVSSETVGALLNQVI